MKKLPNIIALQLALFFYFYIIGMIITNKPDIGEWSDNARLFYVFMSVSMSFISSLIYSLKDNNNERK